jgi:hypothetical protein
MFAWLTLIVWVCDYVFDFVWVIDCVCECMIVFRGKGRWLPTLLRPFQLQCVLEPKRWLKCMDNSLHAPHSIFYLDAAVLTEHRVYVKRQYSVRPATGWIDETDPLLFFSQHDVSLKLATPFPHRLLVNDICNFCIICNICNICNKTYGNLLFVESAAQYRQFAFLPCGKALNFRYRFYIMYFGVEFYRSTWRTFQIS